MKKILVIILLLIPINAFAIEVPNISSTKYIIYDNTDEVILNAKNDSEKASVASLTKIMTSLVAIDKIKDLDDKITITNEMLKDVYWDASIAGIKVGDNLSYRELLYALLLPSGADAAHSLAISLSGSLNKYVDDMNNYAKKIGLNHTHFSNVVGLDDSNHYSTLDDMLKLLKHALSNKTFREVYGTRKYTLSTGLNLTSTLVTYNKQHLNIERIKGAKTGFTEDAGYCLSSYFDSNDHEIIMITLGAEHIGNNFYHISDTVNLIPYVDKLLYEKLEEQRLVLLEESQQEEEKYILQENQKLEKKNIYLEKYEFGIIVFALLVIVIIFSRGKKRKN